MKRNHPKSRRALGVKDAKASGKTFYVENLKDYRKPLYEKLSPFLEEVKRLSQEYWGERLTSLVVFGSYARGEVSLASDLDLLVIVQKATNSFRARSLAFAEYLEKNLKASPSLDVSPCVFTEDELKTFHPLLLDIRKHHLVLYDKGFFKELLESLNKLYKEGAFEELKSGSQTYWRIDYEKIGERLP